MLIPANASQMLACTFIFCYTSIIIFLIKKCIFHKKKMKKAVFEIIHPYPYLLLKMIHTRFKINKILDKRVYILIVLGHLILETYREKM